MNEGGRHTKKEAVEVELPEEILIKILTRLPVKSLLQFKTVCKSWYSIINSKHFVKEQLNHAHSSNYNQHKNLLGFFIPSRKSKHCVLYKEISDGSILAKECHVPIRVVEVCNYCDGLICFNMPRNGILLWNPSLPLEYKVIPMDDKMKRRSKRYDFFVGMGYDSITDDYKIVKVPESTYERYFFVDVFLLRSNSWSKREISKNFAYTIQENQSIYTRNRLHWIGEHFVVYFDMVEERLDHVNFPDKSGVGSREKRRWPEFYVMFDYKDSLAILDLDALWVLVDYKGMKSSWNKIFERSKMIYVDMKFIPYSYSCFTRDGKLLIHPRRHAPRTYDLKDGRVEDVMVLGDSIAYREALWLFDALPYVESLVSPRWWPQ